MANLVVLGGGITGLSTAFYLKQRFNQPSKIYLVEKSNRLGGWVESKRLSIANGDPEKHSFLFETGPRSLRLAGNGAVTFMLARDLNILDKIVVPDDYAHRRFILNKGKLLKLPESFFQAMFHPATMRTIPSILGEFFKPPKEDFEEDESIHDFMSRRFSPYIAETFASAMVVGIFAGDSKKLSMRSCFSNIAKLEQEYGSVVKGTIQRHRESMEVEEGDMDPLEGEEELDEDMSELLDSIKESGGMYSFKEGLETLPRALHENLKTSGVNLSVGTEAASIEPSSANPHMLDVKLSNGQVIQAGHVFSCLPSHSFAQVLERSPSRDADSQLIQNLKAIEHASVAVVNLGFVDPVLASRYQGFGYLVSPKEEERILGVTCDSVTFSQHNNDPDMTRLSVMIGGSFSHPNAVDVNAHSETELVDIALDAIGRHFNIHLAPNVTNVRVCKQCIPQYTIGHLKRVQNIAKLVDDKYNGGLSILGSSYYGVSINDCVFAASQAVDELSEEEDPKLQKE